MSMTAVPAQELKLQHTNDKGFSVNSQEGQHLAGPVSKVYLSRQPGQREDNQVMLVLMFAFNFPTFCSNSTSDQREPTPAILI